MENAYMASNEVFRLWQVDLSNEDDDIMYKKYFEPTWSNYASNQGTVIGSDQSVDFMRSYINSITGE
jgi:hypothetical protein